MCAQSPVGSVTGGGGTTTLKVYSAFVAEADQRAAGALAGHLPALPARLVLADGEADLSALMEAGDRDRPYRRIAADLRGGIVSGAWRRVCSFRQSMSWRLGTPSHTERPSGPSPFYARPVW